MSFYKKWNDGHKCWYVDNTCTIFHRENKPAWILPNRSKRWYINGKLHRINGPAIDNLNGLKGWYINGERHRIDGPAINWSNGNIFWYVNGNHITDEVNEWMEENNITYPFNENELIQFKLRFL